MLKVKLVTIWTQGVYYNTLVSTCPSGSCRWYDGYSYFSEFILNFNGDIFLIVSHVTIDNKRSEGSYVTKKKSSCSFQGKRNTLIIKIKINCHGDYRISHVRGRRDHAEDLVSACFFSFPFPFPLFFFVFVLRTWLRVQS